MNPKIHPAVQAYGKPSTYHRAMSLPPPFARRSAMGAIDRPKKPSGRHAARLRRDGITARLSCSFNFLATRERKTDGIWRDTTEEWIRHYRHVIRTFEVRLAALNKDSFSNVLRSR